MKSNRTTSGVRKTVEAGPPPKDWEDEYHRLKMRFDELKVDYNDKEQHNKILQSKIRKLESDLSQITRQLGGAPAPAVDRDEKNLISALNDQVAKLQDQNTGLNSKVQQLTTALDKKKKEITELNRSISTLKKSQPAGREKPGSGTSSSGINNTATVSTIPAQTTMKPSPAVQKLPDEAQLNDSSLLELQQLQTQYDYLLSKTNSQADTQRQLESHNNLRRALEELRYEKEICDAKIVRTEGLEDFLRERESLQAKVEHLQEAVRTHFSALTTLKQHASQLREEKEKSDQLVEELQLSLKEVQVGKNMLQDQLQVYSGDGGVDIDLLERALTLVKRRSEAVERHALY
eukprot:gene27120-35840_t